MELRENINPKWTERHIEFIKNYKDAYGLTIEEQQYRNELENIKKNNPTMRCNKQQRLYEIYNENIYVGDIILEETNEISILIFDEYMGKGHATNAIKLLINKLNLDYLEAVVRADNNSNNIIKVLTKLNFNYDYTEKNGNKIYSYGNSLFNKSLI